MRIKEVNVGNGVARFDVEPMTWDEKFTPRHAVETMIKDIIKEKKKNNVCVDRNPWNDCNNWNRCQPIQPMREPDGIDVHVDRPLRENFWSHCEWADAMAKYRTLERVAKDCDWPCKEPMKTVQDCCCQECRNENRFNRWNDRKDWHDDCWRCNEWDDDDDVIEVVIRF